MVVGQVDALGQALGEAAFHQREAHSFVSEGAFHQREDHSFVSEVAFHRKEAHSFVLEVACYQMEDPALAEVDHDLVGEDWNSFAEVLGEMVKEHPLA